MSSLSVSAIPKIVAVILVICLARAAAGSCLSYGHSCWGGHGKRSTSQRHMVNQLGPLKRSDEWYLSKMLKLLKEKPLESSLVYNTQIHDFTTLDKLMRNGHPKYSLTESADDIMRHHESSDVGSDIERDAVENNYPDIETLFLPEEDDFMWNSNVYRNTGRHERKSTG